MPDTSTKHQMQFSKVYKQASLHLLLHEYRQSFELLQSFFSSETSSTRYYQILNGDDQNNSEIKCSSKQISLECRLLLVYITAFEKCDSIKEIMNSDGWWNIWDNMINFTGGVENLDFIVFSKFVRAVINSENSSASDLKVLQENIEIYFSAIPDSVYDMLITGKSNSPHLSAARLNRYSRAYQSIVQSYCVDVLGKLGKYKDATEFLNNNEILDERVKKDIESQVFQLENPQASPKIPTETQTPINEGSVISSTTATDQPLSDSFTEATDPAPGLPSTATTNNKTPDSLNSNSTPTSDVMVTVRNGVTMLRDQFRPLLPFFRQIQSYIPGVLIVVIIVSAVFRRRQPSKSKTFRRDVRLQRNQGLASQLFAKLIDTVKMGYNIT